MSTEITLADVYSRAGNAAYFDELRGQCANLSAEDNVALDLHRRRMVFQGMNKQEKHIAIVSAGTTEEVDEMWSAWEERGHSSDGILSMLCVDRRGELGADLSDGEKEMVTRVLAAARRGAAEPPIGGSFSPGG